MGHALLAGLDLASLPTYNERARRATSNPPDRTQPYNAQEDNVAKVKRNYRMEPEDIVRLEALQRLWSGVELLPITAALRECIRRTHAREIGGQDTATRPVQKKKSAGG